MVYGTTNLKMQQRQDDFFVTKLSEVAACGLDRATRFDLDQVAWLPWASEWFGPVFAHGPLTIGALTAQATKMLQITVALKQARAAVRLKAPELDLGGAPHDQKPQP